MQIDTYKNLGFGSLYFNSYYGKGMNLLTFIFRLLTQIWTSSGYEHQALILKCPQKYSGNIYKSVNKEIKLELNEYYVIESTKSHGVIIMPFMERLKMPSLADAAYSGKIDIQLNKSTNSSVEVLEKVWEKIIPFIGRNYNVIGAILSALSPSNPLQKLYKIIFGKKKINKLFCSVFFMMASRIFFNYVMSDEDILEFSPKEVADFHRDSKYTGEPLPLVEYKEGEIKFASEQFLFTL